MASIKYARTASGAISVQAVRKHHGHTEVLKHFGSAHTDTELAFLTDQARHYLGLDQQLSLSLDGVDTTSSYPSMDDFATWQSPRGALLPPAVLTGASPQHDTFTARSSTTRKQAHTPEVVATPAAVTWSVLSAVYDQLGFNNIPDPVFKAIVLARVIRPTAKSQVPDILADVGEKPMHVNTVYNSLVRCTKRGYRQLIEQYCHQYVRRNHQVTMVLYDVTTLYFETPKEDEVKKVGMSKERRVDPQIVVSIITDTTRFPLHVEHFHGKTAETSTLVPMIHAYKQAHDIQGLTVVADAAMLSAGNLDALDAAGIDYIVADRLKKAPYMVVLTDQDIESWSAKTADYEVIEAVKTMGSGAGVKQRRTVLAFSPKRYKYDVASLRKQKEKAEAIVSGQKTQRKARFLRREGGRWAVNEDAYDKALSLAGWKGYVTSLDAEVVPAGDVIAFYHELYRVEQAFRMAKTDLKARPMFVSDDASIHAHLTVVMAALAVSQHVYQVTGVMAPKLVGWLMRFRHAVIRVNGVEQQVSPRLDPEIVEVIERLKRWRPGD